MSFKSNPCRQKLISDEIDKKEYFMNKKKFKKISYFKWFEKLSYKKHEVNYFENIIKFFHKPTCSSSLGVVRGLFGLMMVLDVPDERELGYIDLKYGDPMRCHFPLFEWLTFLPLEYMGLLYFIMWLGAFGMCLGFKFHLSCFLFIIPYWYIYLLDKTIWNNHSYLYGLLAVLFFFTKASYSFSLDALLNTHIRNKPVPFWNYAIIRFQFFLLYFYAGVKKLDPDWIGGYSMSSLSLHWVFNPFRLLFNNEQIDFWIIHIFGFSFDLTIGFFLLIDKTRPVAILFSSAFHFMNSCMFEIGQFPYVCLVTTPIFCSYNWPEKFWNVFREFSRNHKKFNETNTVDQTATEEVNVKTIKVSWKHKMTCYLLAAYVFIQLFLPFSHFITQGYNNWTNGLYGYSWDMMVKNWDSTNIVIRIIDNQSNQEYFLDPKAWVENTKYSKHGDMLIQYAKCLKRNLKKPEINSRLGDIRPSFNDISIYIDVWCSLNGRFQQRMFDPRQDLLKAEWSPFKKIKWLVPLLSNLSSWRDHLADIEREVFKWSNHSDVLFVADFPGLYLENYITVDFKNVTLTVLKGIVILEQISETENSVSFNFTLYEGDSRNIKEGAFHKVHTISEEPSCYMYAFNNYSTKKLKHAPDDKVDPRDSVQSIYFMNNLKLRIQRFWDSLIMLYACFNKIIFNVPIQIESQKVM